MENTEKTTETSSVKTISVELSAEQYAFLTGWQKSHEQELGIEIPIGAMVRKAVDMSMKSGRAKEERPAPRSFSDRPPRDRDSRDSRDSRSAPRSFGARPGGIGRGGPKFSMTGDRNKTRTFNK